ncbi:hypothetical protein FEM03_12730 [Phragmitibacter flavus]|uniref:Glycosyltransferase RgtA/B/C/D-like domain-containing protein n=1 Tax=Phragmitibacter flavus TaxID=2576071 RepID=A0A5R8KEB3_9BACT|nr:hypothetical protein [Phragmitibacter flavus]TLD70577.1 hypothetical protein FEM03_12730 [Phragmitibacter flavus]
MESVCDQSATKPLQVRRVVGRLVLLVALLGLLAAIMQKYSGWGLMEEREISPQNMRERGGLWMWSLGKREFTPAEERAGVLLENGKPTGSKARRGSELDRGPGWYRLKGSQLRFSPMDGSDPRVNGRRYSLQLPVEVRDKVWWLLAGAFALGFALTRGEVRVPVEGAARSWRRVPPWMKVAAFFVLCLGVRAMQLHGSDYNDGVMSIRGVPASDAGGWHEMAEALADGRGFDSSFGTQRPFYSLFLSLFHQVFGSGIWVSLMTNCLLQALTATTVLVLGGILGSRFVAFTVASWMMFCPMQVALAQVVLTENMGATFGVLGLLVFWRLLRRRTVGAAAAAGLVVGLGNLASGVFLLTVPLYPILIVVFGWWQGWGWGRVAKCAAMFCVMVCALFLPWMFRQQVKYGAFTQSLNTSELLYGGAHPVEKRLTSNIHDEARRDGFGPGTTGRRYNYFMQKYVALVTEHPVRYVKQLSEAFVRAAEYTPRTNPVWQWLTRWLIVLVALGQCVRRKFWLPALPAALALLLLHHVDHLPSVQSLAAGSLIVLILASRRQRVGWWLVVATAVSFLLLAAMSGNVATDRFQTAGDWLLFLIWCGAWERVLVTSSQGLDWLWAKVPGWRQPVPRRLVARAGAWRAHGWRWSARAAWVMSALCGLSVVGALGAYGWRSIHPPEGITLKEGEARALVERTMTGHPDQRVRDIPEKGFAVKLVQFDDYRVRIGKHEDLNSMTRVFERRDHARWVVEARVLNSTSGERRLGLQIPGDLKGIPSEQPLLVVGVYNRGYADKFGMEMELFEVLGICPTRESGSPDEVEARLDEIRWFKYHFDVKESVRRLFLKKP